MKKIEIPKELDPRNDNFLLTLIDMTMNDDINQWKSFKINWANDKVSVCYKAKYYPFVFSIIPPVDEFENGYIEVKVKYHWYSRSFFFDVCCDDKNNTQKLYDMIKEYKIDNKLNRCKFI